MPPPSGGTVDQVARQIAEVSEVKGGLHGPPLLFAPGRARSLEGDWTEVWKSLTHTTGGNVSWMARMSAARRNLKEAVSKTLAR